MKSKIVGAVSKWESRDAIFQEWGIVFGTFIGIQIHLQKSENMIWLSQYQNERVEYEILQEWGIIFRYLSVSWDWTSDVRKYDMTLQYQN